jgi:hypothetical protein
MRITISIETDTPTGHVEWSWHAETGEHGKGRARGVTGALNLIESSMYDCASLRCDGCPHLVTRTLHTFGTPCVTFTCGHTDAPKVNDTDIVIGKRPAWCPTRETK